MRVALVTGAGGGSLGEATARALRDLGWRVLTTTRSCAVEEDQHPLDLTERASVARLGEWVSSTTDRLDALVNNAGVHLDLRSKWRAPQLVDGHEVHWRTNYLGTAQLTRLLLPSLLDTATRHGEARVVDVVSKLHERGRNAWLWGDLAPYDSWAAYGTSKLALVHEAAEVERRFGGQGVHGYSLHPGSVYTHVADRGLETAPVLARLRRLAAPLERRALATPADGARTTVFCATSPEAVPGAYHRRSAVAEPSPEALDADAASRLWDATSRWVDGA
ncbi:SDR family NAD(P)-dependent oxidoreductase [Nocardioides sp. 503]|uniref:SDR family NAD(P)-dependent oxidoreductase n=1 Tax=Nocardioides sp. 503 TaxID=2508326 RepID=UPI00106F2E20|nr:SDR family NAD(P)-dependent oxidoreductase [Nocardioides sp. 503]